MSKLTTLTKYDIQNSKNLNPGGIPDLSRNTNLNYLDIGDTNRTGSLPPWIGSLSKLQFLNLYVSLVPCCYNNDSRYCYLLISYYFWLRMLLPNCLISGTNKFTGEIPILNLPFLRAFYCDKNPNLGGPIFDRLNAPMIWMLAVYEKYIFNSCIQWNVLFM